MSLLSLVLPVIGQPSSTEDPKTDNAFTAIQTWANGNIDGTNLSAAAAQSAAVNQASQTVKGSSIIATSQSTSSTTYTTLGTPDQVSNVVLASAGLLAVWYKATWQESVNNAARAAIFLGSNQLEIEGAVTGGSPIVQETALNSHNGPAIPAVLISTQLGLNGNFTNQNINAYTGDVTTGQVLGEESLGTGGACFVFAAAGTYTVTVQFKVSSGSVTVQSRRLYVQALSFS